MTRRDFLALLQGAAVAWGVPRGAVDHPPPRPNIDAARVLTADRLHEPDAAPVFDLVREIPQVADGIRCYCGCAHLDGYYSLLSCYEGAGMAQHCEVCQGEARLAHKLHGQGWSLNGIRSAIDATYG